jgi:MarR family transcriptional regulator, organic hydroperoxide resistance regulator
MKAERVRAIQRWYPQIYLACHTRHQRASSSDARLSANDSSVLAHLDERDAMTAGNLARHLGIGASTLSATINRLVKLGYITRTPATSDRRTIELRLSKTGARAMQGSSVLESARVAALLAELTPGDQQLALDGLALLARAARQLSARSTSDADAVSVATTKTATARKPKRRV